MTEDELRALVREIVSRVQVGGSPGPEAAFHVAGDLRWKTHASHLRFSLPTGQQGDGPCLVEPAVRCTHCGYCQSFGH